MLLLVRLALRSSRLTCIRCVMGREGGPSRKAADGWNSWREDVTADRCGASRLVRVVGRGMGAAAAKYHALAHQ
jgi:hypothetical protein